MKLDAVTQAYAMLDHGRFLPIYAIMSLSRQFEFIPSTFR